MRAAIYARLSTDKQDLSSIADQYRVCTDFATRQGWKVVARYADEGISGAAIGNRPGFNTMMDAATRDEIDVLLVVELSRLSRSAGDLNKTIDRLTFRGVRVIGVSNGYDSARKGHKMQAGFEGLMGEQFREMIREKTYGALQGRAMDGRRTGGISYGYRSVEGKAGRLLEIDQNTARWVVWIFERFVAGWSPRSIAQELNRTGIPSSRGGTWAFTAIYGDKVRCGVGILNNPLYIGRVIWNRSQWTKDPDTGKRKRKERPESEWIVRVDESLRIVSAELWDAAQARLAASTLRGGSRGKARPKTLLGGLLRCGSCGGAVVAVDAHSYGCAARRDRGNTVCAGVLVSRSTTEQLLVEDLREDMLSPLRLSQLHFDVRALLRTRRVAVDDALSETRRRLVQIETEIANIVAAVKAGAYSQVLQSELARLEAERERLQAAMSKPVRQCDPALEEIPRLVERYRRMVEELRDALARRTERSRAILSEALGDVVLVKESDGAVYAEFEDPAHRLLVAVGGGSSASGSGGRI